MRFRSLNFLLVSFLLVLPSSGLFGAATVYTPGDPIPDGSFASVGVFGPLFQEGYADPPSGPAYIISGVNTQELYFQAVRTSTVSAEQLSVRRCRTGGAYRSRSAVSPRLFHLHKRKLVPG